MPVPAVFLTCGPCRLSANCVISQLPLQAGLITLDQADILHWCWSLVTGYEVLALSLPHDGIRNNLYVYDKKRSFEDKITTRKWF